MWWAAEMGIYTVQQDGKIGGKKFQQPKYTQFVLVQTFHLILSKLTFLVWFSLAHSFSPLKWSFRDYWISCSPCLLPCLTLQRILDLELYLESFPSSEQSNSSKVFNPLVEITQKQEAHINLAVQIAVQKRKAGVADVDWLKNPAEEEMDMLVWKYIIHASEDT